MKDQVKTPILVAIVVLAVGVIGYFGVKSMSAGDLDQGQVKYTPGKPPWMETDDSKKGPGGGPPPAASSDRMPPGMTPPAIGGNGK